jgi:hypothetical protein
MDTANAFVINWGAFWGVIPGGLVFGLAYNAAVSWMNRNGYAEDLTWLQVVVGVAATLAFCIPVIGFHPTLAVLVVFASTGLFMCAGDIWRGAVKRKEFIAFWKGERP